MSSQAPIPPVDRRSTEIRHLDLPYEFTPPRKKPLWDERARALREHILVSLGLWPKPDKCPLNAEIFDRIERDDYTVEKVYFESLPGFFVTGNLYRPVGVDGPCPGVLNPHGHWSNGRMADSDEGSLPGRCIGFARQGCVAFSWDMIGYNDSQQAPHREFGGKRELLWGISMMGLQLWNSIRAVDFLESLPDVDKKRIACTGESGGGTQTFMLTAVEDRIMLSAPVNMISSYMQGGCLCENGPNIRINTNNMEIGALMAPRPMMMISATGDWTVNTPDLEYPAIRDIYKLYEAEDRLGHVQVDAGHNYNQSSRNAVYAWFGKWLFNSNDAKRFTERPFKVEKPEDLLVFGNRPLPDHAVDAEGLTAMMIERSETQFRKMKLTDTKELRKFRKMMNVAYRSVLGASVPARDDLIVAPLNRSQGKGYTTQRLYIGRKGVGDRIPAVVYTPEKPSGDTTLMVHPEGCAGLVDAEKKLPGALLRALFKRGQRVMLIDAFRTGESQSPREMDKYHFPDTYNLTDTSHRVQDIITAVTYLRESPRTSSIALIGLDEAGLWGLLACGLDPHIARAVIDTNQFENNNDEAYLNHLYIPCLRRIGDVRTAAALAAPAALMLHNTGTAFQTEWIEEVYRVADARDRLRVHRRRASVQDMVKWVVDGPRGR